MKTKKTKQPEEIRMVALPEQNWEEVLSACVNAESEVIHLQNQIEELNLQIEDADEIHRRLATEFLRIKGQGTIEAVAATRTKADLETRVAKLLRDLDSTEANRKYACDHISEQNKLIRDAKTAMESIRDENAQLKAKQVNAEHLATKVIQLQTEIAKSDFLACPYQKTKDIIHIPCGKCNSCKLEAAHGIIERSAELCKRLEKERDAIRDKEKFTSSVLEQTSRNLMESNKENEHLKKSLEAEIKTNAEHMAYKKHLLEIIRLQGRGLELANASWPWERKSYVETTIEAVGFYKTAHKIPNA